jgi:hypothetical protein
MNYREIKRLVRKEAADHLYSLEVYDLFDVEDADRVDRAIWEIQFEIRGKAGRLTPAAPDAAKQREPMSDEAKLMIAAMRTDGSLLPRR